MTKKVLLGAMLAAAVGGGALVLYSQQTRQKAPPKPGTLRAMIENPSVTGDIRVGRHVRIPMYENLAALEADSDAVIHGRVLAARSYPCDEMTFVCTEFRFQIHEVLTGSIPRDRRGTDRIPILKDRTTGKQATRATPAENRVAMREGPGPDEIVVTQAGGVLVMDGRRIVASIADQEMLLPKAEYVLYVKWVPENGPFRVGRNTYHLTAGPQSAIALEDGQARSLVPRRFWNHPIRSEVDGPFHGDRERVLLHLRNRRN